MSRIFVELSSSLISFFFSEMFIFFVVNHYLNPTSKLQYFEHIGGHDGTVQIRLREEFLLCHQGTRKECRKKVLIPSSNIMREFITNAVFEGKDRKKMKQPNFHLGDKMELPKDCFYYGN